MKEIVEAISGYGLSVVIVGYFIFKDWYQTKNTYELLSELKSLLVEFKDMLINNKK